MAQKQHTDEFKKEAVRLTTFGEKSVAQMAREQDTNDNILYA